MIWKDRNDNTSVFNQYHVTKSDVGYSTENWTLKLDDSTESYNGTIINSNHLNSLEQRIEELTNNIDSGSITVNKQIYSFRSNLLRVKTAIADCKNEDGHTFVDDGYSIWVTNFDSDDIVISGDLTEEGIEC